MSSEPLHIRELTGDGYTVRWDLGVEIRQIVGVRDASGEPVAFTQDWKCVDIYPPLPDGERVTVYFLSDYL